ncbi:ATP-dependent helicase [Janibacter alkaliphilus]|uniref:ATP-dependent Lhr-like helicase n=1 Tax=Janibacter alkaliphilus TaxID=1069963 RepID=A0A852X556_9MICO|nr:ATP-dependent helicase [Janibacter alkaliphilus]NYG38512.1 ATP-dependent Lhr-like helicase [Janibacter alkaliphilus]
MSDTNPPGPPGAADSPASSTDVLERFSPATRDWFRGSFAEPTSAQRGAWHAISSGQHALVVAPTGSGKTLSAFLWALDRLASTPPPQEALARCRVLYVSPLKALAVDVERNLRSPLVGIGHAAARLGLDAPEVTVGVRSGDTPAAERRAFAKTPTDVLITTPESLFLMLTSGAREALQGVETVIIDEIHAMAGTKRGAHLALSLERLDEMLPQPAQRVGLSATVRPVEEVARFLAGGRPVEIVQPTSTKQWQLDVVVPVADLTQLGEPTGDLTGQAAGEERRASIWPHVEERVVDLVAAHRTTLVFVNSRRIAERLTGRLNELWAERQVETSGDADGATDEPRHDEGGPSDRTAGEGGARPPAEMMAQSGASAGAPPVIARAHHGSVSKEQRDLIEDDLKAGRLPCVVATSSLELGIDMGAIDLVVQIESPPSVASGLQRVGRAGHQVGAVSHGVVMPKFRGDLVQSAVVVERMRAGDIEALHVPTNPLDVLAQQVVAMCALDDWQVPDLEALVRRAAPFASLPSTVLHATLDMLAGRYPSDEFAELRPRLTWDRGAGTLSGRRGAQRLAVTSGGTIPDRGLYGVFLAGSDGPGRRVGELDEEMVYESRVGDTFTLGTSTWRIQDITHDQVLVTPAPGEPGRLPFWHGDQIGRPAELGAAVGSFVREVGALAPGPARERLTAAGLDPWAADNLLGYLGEQREATGHLPDDRTIVVERFRDEIGDWRVALHSPFGAQVHAPWALAISARMRERLGVDVQAMHGDDGIVLRLPDVELDGGDGPGQGARAEEILDLITLDPSDVETLVTEEIGGSALFAARFRECAARALLLPRRRPDRRTPLWQQRQRAAALLEVASGHAQFPIVLETVRECLQDVFDVPALTDLMTKVAGREVSLVDVESPRPSPFAASLMFGYVAQFLYEGDSPLAERRAAALTLDPTLLADLLGRGEQLALADLLDPDAVRRTEAELQHLTPERAARDGEDVLDLLRVLGPLSLADLDARSTEALDVPALQEALEQLRRTRQAVPVRIAGQERWAWIEDAARLRDALGVSLPPGLPESVLTPTADPLGELVARYARTHVPFAAADLATWWGIGRAVAQDALRRLVQSGRVVEGDLLPEECGGSGGELCDAEVLRLLRRRSLAALRHEVEPVDPRQYARFLPSWQGVGRRMRGREGVLRVVEQLSGVRLPASAVESLVLPARMGEPAGPLLDELTAAGEILWSGHGAMAGDDLWVSLHLAETAPQTLPLPDRDDLDPVEEALLAALSGGGARFFRDLADDVARRFLDEQSEAVGDDRLVEALWSLVHRGLVTGDTLAPVRASLAGGRSSHRTSRRPPSRGRYGSRPRLGRSGLPGRSGPPRATGRWSLLPAAEDDPTVRAHAAAEGLLDRHGVVTRGAVAAEDVPGGFAAVHRVLGAAEEAGQVRRGYFVEGLGASQFAAAGAVDQVRSSGGADGAVVLAATDPANPWGAALRWPERDGGHQPGRKAGALVVTVDGALVLYVERGGRTLLTWSEDEAVLARAAGALAEAVQRGALGRLTVQKADGADVLGSAEPLARALEGAGFHATPRGLRLRPGGRG